MVASQYAVTLTSQGYATGFNAINGGPGLSSFVVVADKFQIQLPGYNGNAPKPFFTTGTVNGIPAIGMRGDFYLDGTFNVNAINVGAINTVHLAINSVGIDQLIANSASKSWVNATGAKTIKGSGGKVTVWSDSLSITGDAVTVGFGSQWRYEGTGLATGAVVYPTINFEVNGVVQRKYQWTVGFNGPSGGLLLPFFVEHALQGLSAGTYTVAITTDAGGQQADGTPSKDAPWLSDGQVRVTNLRR